MLARSAQGIYWMGRYLERTECLCRLMQIQTEALVDRPARDIYVGWRRLYGVLRRIPPGGILDIADSDDFTLADSYTLAGDLTFERSNPDSVWNCFAQGRENARQTRHCISVEMWQRLNLAYLRLRDMDIEDIWSLPEGFYLEMAAETDGVDGAAQATMYRDEGWSFLRLGGFIERAQFATALLLQQLAIDAESDGYAEEDWVSLLEASHALEVYNRRYGAAIHPQAALDLLVTDPLLPGSLGRSFNQISQELARLGTGPGTDSGRAAGRLTGRMLSLLQNEWPDSRERETLLRRVLDEASNLHFMISEAYFDYPLNVRAG
ncbi:MAG: alpha-E domain-containing protein [Chloroflexi bacterium]|nr:alpha-E domain-containing protein [Chloroflexota bacterium]